MERSWLSVADVGVGACIVVTGVVTVDVGVVGVGVGVCIVVNCAVGVGACVVVYVGVGGGMHFTSCANNSFILAFCCLFVSFLLYHNVLENMIVTYILA